MFKFLRKNNTIDGNWLKVSDLKVGMQIAVPREGVLEMHQNGQIGNGDIGRTQGQSQDGDDVLWDEIESIEYVGTEQVWDIEVEDTHNFVGNNIFAHNTYIQTGGNFGVGYDPSTISNGVAAFNGSVGIGTTAPTALLDIKTAAGFTRGIRVGPQNGNINDGAYIEFNSSATDGYGAQIGGIRTGASGENALVFRTGTNAQAERMRIVNDGTVLINTTTDSAFNLDVNGTGRFVTSLSSPTFQGNSAAVTFGNASYTSAITSSDWAVSTAGAMTGISGIANNGAYTQTGTSANAFTGTSTFSNATYSALFTGGNVGIGIATPSTKLEISGAIKLTGHIQMTSERVYWDNYVSAGLGSNYGYDIYTPNAAFTGSTVKFHVGGYNATSSYFTSGYVGIGITDPNYVLEVRGSSVSSNSDRSVVTALSSSGTYGVIGTLTASPLWIYASGSNVVSVDGSSMTGIGIDVCAYSGSYCLSSLSDERLKDNVLEIGSVLDKVMKLRPITYNWNDTYLQTHPAASKSFTNMGFIAQEIKEVFPEVVVGEQTDSTYLGVDYAHMTPILTMAIQEMNLRLGVLTGEVIPLDGSKEKEFEKKFFDNLFAKVTEWLGSAENGIKTVFARKISTRLLCIADEAGVETCVEKSQLDGLLARAGSASASDANNTGGGVNTEEETDTEINPEAPVIEIIGEGTINLGIGDSYEEAGANATDNKDDFVAVDISGVPDTSKDGIYAIHYNAVDTDGNNALEVIRKIIVGTGVYVITEVSMDGSEGDTSISGTLPEAGETTTITETGGSDDSSAGASTTTTDTTTTTTVSTGVDSGAVSSGGADGAEGAGEIGN